MMRRKPASWSSMFDMLKVISDWNQILTNSSGPTSIRRANLFTAHSMHSNHVSNVNRRVGSIPLLSASWLAVLLVTLLLAGCQHPPQETRHDEIVGQKLNIGSVVYVGIPSDAYYKKQVVVNSGRQTAELLRSEFA